MKKSVLFILSIIFATSVNAQTISTQMGKPTDYEKSLAECPFDKDAPAVVLYEDFDVRMGFFSGSARLQITMKKRIKILKEGGLDAASVSLKLRNDEAGSGYHDNIDEVKGSTYNLVDGKVRQTKMEKSMVAKKRVSENQVTVDFVLPQAQVGSIIEYQYVILRDAILDIPEWVAQNEYPTLLTHFQVAMPGYVSFYYNQTGPDRLLISKGKQANPDFDVEDLVLQASGRNLAALPRDNDYIYCPTDYADKITCEVSEAGFPGQQHYKYSLTQADVNKMLLENKNFGGRLRQKDPLKEEMTAAGIASLPTITEKVVATVNLMRKHLRWNHRFALTGSSLDKVLKEGSGDNADLNFVLMSMLEDAGVVTYPVVMSSRSNGSMPTGRPSIDALNTFVIAFYDESGNIHYYDASAENGYIDALPTELNVDNAILIKSKEEYKAVTLQKNVKRRESITINAEISADGTLTGTYQDIYSDNAALRFRDSWEEKNDSAAFVAEVAADNNCDITEYKTEHREEFSQSVTEEFTFTKHLDGGDKFYLNPFVLPFYGKSPFTAETSSLPIEFPACGMTNLNVTVKLPEGYHAEEMIQPLAMTLPQRGLTVQMVVRENDGTISVSCRITVNQLLFEASSYTYVKQFYDALANKCNEILVISKTAAQ